ncbi:MAG: protein kinase domain-containing protein [Vicinamibacteria bacterium]
MTPERWRRITEVFHSARGRDASARARFLDEACAEDLELRAEVDALLAADRDAGAFGDRPVFAPDDVPSATASAPEVASGRRRHPFVWVACLAFGLSLALFGYAAFVIVRDGRTRPVFGWMEVQRGDGWYIGIASPSGPAAGRLLEGDRVIAMNGVPPLGPTGFDFHCRELSPGDGYVLTIARNGEPRDVSLTVATGPDSLAPRIAYFFVSLIWCAVGLFIGFARPDRAIARLACLSSVATGHVFLSVGIIHLGFIVAPLHGVLGYHFFCRFPSGPIPRGLWRVALGLLYVTGGTRAALGLIVALTVLTSGVGGAVRYANVMQRLELVTLLTFLGAVVGMLLVIPHKYRRLTDPDERRRVRWMVYGSTVALLPNLWYMAVALLEGPVGPRLSLFTNASSVAIPICMAYVVVKHRVLDIKVVVRRGVQYLLARRVLQAAVALPLLVLAQTIVIHRHRTIAEIVAENGGYLFWIVAAGVSLRFRRPIQVSLDRRFFREELDREQLLLGLLDDVGKLESLSELSRLVTSKLDAALHPKTVYLWYRDPREFAAASSADPLLTPPDFPPEERWLAWLETRGGAATLPAPADAGLSREEALWFAEREVSLIVPIADSSDRVVGALLVGEKSSEEPYGANDRRLLQAIARQTAVVRENLRLRARVSEEQQMRHDVLARLDGRLPDVLKECPVCGACFDGPIERCEHDGEPLLLTLPVARTLDGRYRLEHLIGKGGMGAVYEARDLRLARVVAVKVLLGRAFGQPAALRRFRREAQSAARLNHPNIVSVFDFGPLEGQGAYLVMERVNGVTLRAEMECGKVIAAQAVADWFEPLLDGLAAAHAQGIVHRDLKPENVIGRRGASQALAVKILDFGLAKFFNAETLASGPVTVQGVILGTPGYMAPEQLLGRETDHRADIFAVGVMLVEALTGRRPFDDRTSEGLALPPPRGQRYLPGASLQTRVVEVLLQSCLAQNPQDRYPSAAELRSELGPALRAFPADATCTA